MPDEILYLISDFLLLKDLVNFIQALPRLLICHGMKTLWMRRMDDQHPRFMPHKMADDIIKNYWLMNNEMRLLSMDHFINIRCQGYYSSHADEDRREYHKLFVKNSRGASRIWNFRQYLSKWRRRATRNRRGPTTTSTAKKTIRARRRVHDDK